MDVLRGKYLRNGGAFLTAPSNPRASWIWKELLKNRDVLLKGACLFISNGSNVDIWSSPWIPLMPNFKPRSNPNLVGFPDFTVEELIIQRTRS